MSTESTPSRSRRRSGQRGRQDAPPEFLVDRSLPSPTIVRVFADQGLRVYTLGDLFGARESHVEDEEWIARASARRLFVLTKDERIRRRPAQRQAIIDGQVGAFFLTSGNLSLDAMSARFTRNSPRIVRICRRTPRPFLYGVYRLFRIEGVAVGASVVG